MGDLTCGLCGLRTGDVRAYNSHDCCQTPHPLLGSLATAAQKHDPVSAPAHYRRGDIECIDAIRAAVTGLPPFEAYLVGNAIKYVYRHDAKGGTEDVRKAIWHLERLVTERAKRGAK